MLFNEMLIKNKGEIVSFLFILFNLLTQIYEEILVISHLLLYLGPGLNLLGICLELMMQVELTVLLINCFREILLRHVILEEE
jgi:hypothetical protein